MQSVESEGLSKLDKDISDFLKRFPNMRKELHEKIADALKKEVDLQIGMSLDDFSGKIKKWQEKYVGSKGGYAAIRPVDTSTGNDSPGAITNYINSGHTIRRPRGKNKYYRANIKKLYVDGRHFYEKTALACEADIISIVEDFVDDISNSFMED